MTCIIETHQIKRVTYPSSKFPHNFGESRLSRACSDDEKSGFKAWIILFNSYRNVKQKLHSFAHVSLDLAFDT